MPSRIPRHARAALALLVFVGACDRADGGGGGSTRTGDAAPRDTVVLYLAASLARPLGPVLDAWGRANGIAVVREVGGSLEHARKITELGRIPDALLLADREVFPRLLVPRSVPWYATVARDRMVIAYTDKSRRASELDSTSWTRILASPDVQVGRSAPEVAPVGYRALVVMQLAERHYHEPGLAARLLANAPQRNVRPNAADLAALLQLGELDYVYDYASVARTFHLRALTLPPAIDLGDPARERQYAAARLMLRSPRGDTATVIGAPILFAIGLASEAPHPQAARRFAAWMLSGEGRSAMRAAGVDALDRPALVGDAPADIRALVASAGAPR